MKNGLLFTGFQSHLIVLRLLLPGFVIVALFPSKQITAQKLKHIGYNKAYMVMEEDLVTDKGFEQARREYKMEEEKNLRSQKTKEGSFVLGQIEKGKDKQSSELDNVGSLVLIEDKTKPHLHLRLQKIHASYIEVKIYSENGTLIQSENAKNLFLGTELVFDHSFWPTGLCTLQVRMDNGQKWTKKIRKSEPVVAK